MNLDKSIIVLREWANKFDIRLPKTDKELLELEILEHTNGFISYIPDEICILKDLKKLILTNNCISELFPIPENVVFLNLSGNKITRFEISCFEKARCLKFLYLGKNQISYLPVSIEPLCGLYCLDLSFNLIENADIFFFIPSLSVLNLSGNKKIKKIKSPIYKKLSLLDISKTNVEYLTKDNFGGFYTHTLVMKKNTIKKVSLAFFSCFNEGIFILDEKHRDLWSFLVFKFAFFIKKHFACFLL